MLQGVDVRTLRELLRHYHHFRSLYASDGIDTIRSPTGVEFSFWDLEYLYREGLPMLPKRQRQAIQLCLIEQWREREAAVMMGVSPENPVASYATSGLVNLLKLVEAGKLPRIKGWVDGPNESWSSSGTGEGSRPDAQGVASRGQEPQGEVGHPDRMEDDRSTA